MMPLATYYVYVDWNDDGDFTDTYENISAYVKEINTERGRNSALDNCMVGTAEIVVDNQDKRFSPRYASGPMYGNLLPGRKIKITALYNAVTYQIFNGYLKDIRPMPNPRRKDCYIYAEGQLRRLKTKIDTWFYSNHTEAELLGHIINHVEKTGETIPTSFDDGADTYNYSWWHDEEALEAAFDVAESALGFFYERADGYLIYENRNHRAAHTSQWTCTNDMFDMTPHYDTVCCINRAITLATKREAEGDNHEIYSMPEVVAIAASDTLKFEVTFTDPWNVLVLPVADIDYTFNSQADGEGTDLTANLSVIIDTPYRAQTVGVTIYNTVATAGYLTAFGLRGELLIATEMTRRRIDDQVSIDDNGLYVDDYDGGYINTVAQAVNRSTILVDRYAEPVPHVSLVLRPDTSMKLTQMLTREISDFITVVETQTAINNGFYIEKIKHRITPSMHETTWLCSQRDVIHRVSA